MSKKPSFAQILSSLRHKRGLSQKKVADELGISQALLSHYENGVREPKLEFVVKVSEYYGVTTDYLLGLSTECCTAKLQQLCTSDGSRRCIDNAVVLMALLRDIGDAQLMKDAGYYMGYALNLVLSYLRFPQQQYEPLYDAAMKRIVSSYLTRIRSLRKTTDTIPDMPDEVLKKRFPSEYGSISEIAELIRGEISYLTDRADN
jgi:transcriptional regulator with XRE-family HTH domain